MLLVLMLAVNIAAFLPPCDSLGVHTVELSGYKKWISPGQVDNVLYCPQSCSLDDEKDRCCSCEAKRCWEINSTLCGDVIGQLYIEYSDIFGRATVIPEPDVNATLYELIHLNGRLAYIPQNICSYGNITVTINLANNRLSDISLLKCMTKLDTLILDYNDITSVDNTTFSNMENLRKLSMSHCGITSMDPNAIAILQGNVLSVDLSYNDIESLDVTNIFRNGSFCSISYEGTIVKETTNILNTTFKEGELMGPGTINFNSTKLGSFFNFSTLGVPNYRDLMKYVTGRIYIDKTSIECDCNLYPMFDGLGQAVFDLWGNLDDSNFICQSPERMKGFNLSAIFDGNKMGELTCDIQVNCPRFCQCIDTPSKGHVVVNCSRAGLAKMPSDMPFGLWNNYKINLLLEDNSIHRVENRNYLYRLVNLDMAGNNITFFDEEFAAKMNDELITEIDDQQLTTLPRRLQSRDPRNFKFGLHPILCTCENTWIGDWMRYYNARNLLRCLAYDENIDTAVISGQYLGCEPEETRTHPLVILSISALVLSVFVLLLWIVYFFRFEILILKRKCFSKQKPDDDTMYDVFMSLCENNDDVFSWVHKEAMPFLRDAGYSVYSPWLDMHRNFGKKRDTLIVAAIEKSKHYVVCLCDYYQSDTISIDQFNRLWNKFLSDESKRITIINFGPLRKRLILDKRLKAFLRIRDDLNYKRTDIKLIERLKKRIGPPRVRPSEHLDQQNETVLLHDKFNHETNLHNAGNHVDARTLNQRQEPSGGAGEMSSVFDRLAVRPSICNCKYRRCYLHPGYIAEDVVNVQHIRERQSTFYEIKSGRSAISRRSEAIEHPQNDSGNMMRMMANEAPGRKSSDAQVVCRKATKTVPKGKDSGLGPDKTIITGVYLTEDVLEVPDHPGLFEVSI